MTTILITAGGRVVFASSGLHLRPIDSSSESHVARRARRFWGLAAELTGADPLPDPGTGS
jgi:hypothetical protein